MKHILKQFAAWATSFKQSEFERASIKLALWHSLGILIVLAISSVLVIALYVPTRPLIVPEPEHGELSFYELREHLVEVVVMVDVATLLVVMFFSYLDARRTLRPIEVMYRTQERFLGDVAHELRTPLTVMKAGAETLLRQERGVSTYKSYITDSLEEIDRMTEMVNNLLFLLRQKEVAGGEYLSVDLAEIVQKQIALFESYAATHAVTLSATTAEALVHGVPNSLHRLVQNLLKNAIDYNVAGGSVTVSVVAEGSSVVCTVADTGIGIAPNDTKRVYDRFYRADQSRNANDKTGTGLGLSIVKAIVNAHKGTIDIQSTKGIGTTVKVVLPKV
jgi:signal transduction histidine kinase